MERLRHRLGRRRAGPGGAGPKKLKPFSAGAPALPDVAKRKGRLDAADREIVGECRCAHDAATLPSVRAFVAVSAGGRMQWVARRARMRPRRAQGRGAGSFAAAAAGRVTGRAGARTRRTDRTLGGSAQALSPAWFWRRVTASAACYAGPASGIEGTSGLRGMAEIEVPRRCGTQGGAPWSKAESMSNRDTFHRFSAWEQDGYLCHRSGRGSKLSPCHLRAGVEVVVIT